MHAVCYLSDMAYAVSDALFMPLHEANEHLRSILDANENNNQEVFIDHEQH